MYKCGKSKPAPRAIVNILKSARRYELSTMSLKEDIDNKITTMRIPLGAFLKFERAYKAHQDALEVMGIDGIPAFYRWCANEGLPIVEEKLAKIDTTKKEKI